MLVDHAAALRRVKDMRNFLDALHREHVRIKTKVEGYALSDVTRILHSCSAFHDKCMRAKAIIDGYDHNTDHPVPIDESAHVRAYLASFERTNRPSMGRQDRMAFHTVRGLFEELSTDMTVDDYYKEYLCW